WTDVNQGTSPPTFGWSDYVYLSTSPTLNAPGARQTFLSSFFHSDTLASGASKPFQQTFALPPDASGQYVIVQTISSEDPFPNNNAPFGPTNVTPRAPANLHVTKVEGPGSSPSGDPITVTWTVTNDGGDAWAGNQDWTDEVFVSPDPVFYPNRATV